MANISFTFHIFALQNSLNRMKTLLAAVAIIAISVVLLGVKVFFVKNGKFPSGHIGSDPNMRKRGIGCAAHSSANKPKN